MGKEYILTNKRNRYTTEDLSLTCQSQKRPAQTIIAATVYFTAIRHNYEKTMKQNNK